MTADRPDDAQVLLSDDERARMVEMLRRHLVDGRLQLAAFEERVGLVLAAERRGEADRVFADLPVLAPVDDRGGGRKRRRRGGGPEPGWRPTDELFRDPGSGRLTRVWVDPGTGSRHYLPD